MRLLAGLILSFLVSLSLGQAALAQEPGQGTWRGEYFNNTTLSGEPRLVRDDLQIDFDWGLESPAQSRINRDNFSARWTQMIDLPANLYRFEMTVDDGGRLWVDDRLLIDAWQVQSPRKFAEEIYLSGGPISVRMEYFEAEGEAVARLAWAAATENLQNWQGEYYNNPTLAGDPILVREEPEINFRWGRSSPAPDKVGVDQFSARWRRTLTLPAGAYCFVITVDDGGRLSVNGDLLIDAWKIQAQETYAHQVDLPGGVTALKLEYFEDVGEAVAQLSWFKLDSPVPESNRYSHQEGLSQSLIEPATQQPVVENCKTIPALPQR